MARVGILFFLCFLLPCLVSKASEEFTLKFIYDALSGRMDNIVKKINKIRTEHVETKSAVNSIERRMENIEQKMSATITAAEKNVERMCQSLINDTIQTVGERSESLINDEIKNMQDNSESLNNEMKRQSVAVQKMLFKEKKILREVVKRFEDNFSTFQTDMKSQMTWMNTSVESSVDNLEHSMTQHKEEMNIGLQNVLNETDVMDTEFRNIVEDSNMKIEKIKTDIDHQTDIKIKELKKDMNDVSQNILTRTNSDLQSAKRGINSRLNNEESRLSSMSSTVTSLARTQESHKDSFYSQMSLLSSRITKEEARTVAFSARLGNDDILYLKDVIIIFDEVAYNYGGGYSSSTGIFTAPKSGTYLFTFNVESYKGQKAHVGLKVRGYWKSSAIVEGDGTSLTGGNAGIDYLSKGDKAWIQTGNQDIIYFIYPYRTTFNGILID